MSCILLFDDRIFSHRNTFSLLDQCDDSDNRHRITYSVKSNTSKATERFLGRSITDQNVSSTFQKLTDFETMETLEYIEVDFDNEEIM